MATRMVFEDDLDGTVGDVETVDYEFNGAKYSIDLSEIHRKELQEALEAYESAVEMMGRFIEVSRTVRAAKTSRKAQSVPKILPGHSLTDVREWAKTEDIEISTKGRIPGDIIEKFNEAHQG